MIKVDETDPVGDIELKFPYRQVSVKRGEDVKQYYELNEEIGRGKFGTVYKCKEKKTNLCLAAKFIAVTNRKERKNVEREIEMMNRLQHPKIIQLYDAFEYNKMVCVVLELIDGGELFDRVLDDKFILTEKACSIFMRQICEAMDYIHERNIIHLDLKPENILCLTESGNRIKIIDFGLAREYDPTTKLQVLFGTPEFVAPEVVNFDAITFATDMWSVGVIAYVLVSGLSPFAGECDVETMGNVTVGKYDFNDEAFDNVSAECIDFITKLLMKDHDTRLTAKEALRHKWVKKRPQYTPTSIVKAASSSLSFKPVYSDKDNTLTAAKDNLRNCVGRWNDSTPYVFDKHSKSISSVHSSISSSIDTSPSLAGSFSNSSECLAAHDDSDSVEGQSVSSHENEIKINMSSPLQLTEPPRAIMSLKDYLHALDRHKSIDNCFLGTDRLFLFDEIKKITDHLFTNIAPEPRTNGDDAEHDNQTANNRLHDMNMQNANSTQTTAADVATLKDGDGVDVENVKTRDESLDVNNNKINGGDDDGEANTSRSHPFSEIFKRFSSLCDSGSSDQTNAPWPVSTKRTKFRINQMSSRDVPIVRTERPAKLQKQNAIDACDTRMFDEQINRKSIFHNAPGAKSCIVDLLESFERDRDRMLQSHFRHKTFVDRMPSESISFDYGHLGVERGSMNTIRSLFQLHATTGKSVKQIQAKIEALNK